MHLQTQNQIRDHHRALYDSKRLESLDWYGLGVPSGWYNMAVTQVRAHRPQHFRRLTERRTEHLYIALGHENVAEPVARIRKSD